MIGITVVIGIGFLAMIAEVGYIFLEHILEKEHTYQYLIEKINSQDKEISELKVLYGRRKK